METINCSNRQIVYGILAVLIGFFANWFGSIKMKTYEKERVFRNFYTTAFDNVNNIEVYKYLSITSFVIGTLSIGYGVVSVLLRNNPHFCALMSP